jgi:hypothetical protein
MHGTTCSVAIVAVLVSYLQQRTADPIADVPFDLFARHLVITKGAIGALNNLSLLIDTGTIPSVVDSRIARKLHLHTETSQLVAFGQHVAFQSAELDGIRIGSLRSGPVPAAVGDLSYLDVSALMRLSASTCSHAPASTLITEPIGSDLRRKGARSRSRR